MKRIKRINLRTVLLRTGMCMILCLMALPGLVGCGTSDDGQAAEEPAAVEETTVAEEATTEAPQEERISEEEALSIATDAEGLYIDDVDDIHVEFDDSEGVEEYDITFRYEGVEYEYSIDVYTGDIYVD